MYPLLPPLYLLLYFIVFVLLAFVWRSLVVYFRTGINPFVLPSGDDTYGFVGRAFRAVVAATAVMNVVLVASTRAPRLLGAWPELQLRELALAGWILLGIALVLVCIAQAQMGNAWRIGIDRARATPLVSHGLFRLSRNPIYLAMRLMMLGQFCIVPAAASLTLLVAADLLMQVQVRLEEQHLAGLHGERYAAYRARVRRWL